MSHVPLNTLLNDCKNGLNTSPTVTRESNRVCDQKKITIDPLAGRRSSATTFLSIPSAASPNLGFKGQMIAEKQRSAAVSAMEKAAADVRIILAARSLGLPDVTDPPKAPSLLPHHRAETCACAPISHRRTFPPTLCLIDTSQCSNASPPLINLLLRLHSYLAHASHRGRPIDFTTALTLQSLPPPQRPLVPRLVWADRRVSLGAYVYAQIPLDARGKALTVVNHLPGMVSLTTKSFLARRTAQMRALAPPLVRHCPPAWLLPQELAAFKQYFDSAHAAWRARGSRGPPPTYILKPNIGSKGDGIRLACAWTDVARGVDEMARAEQNATQSAACADAGVTAQLYLSRPMLLDELKFDFRVYVLVSSLQPWRAYVYREGLARFATQPYVPPAPRNLHQVHMHLTNYSLNKDSDNYVEEGFKDLKRERARARVAARTAGTATSAANAATTTSTPAAATAPLSPPAIGPATTPPASTDNTATAVAGDQVVTDNNAMPTSTAAPAPAAIATAAAYGALSGDAEFSAVGEGGSKRPISVVLRQLRAAGRPVSAEGFWAAVDELVLNTLLCLWQPLWGQWLLARPDWSVRTRTATANHTSPSPTPPSPASPAAGAGTAAPAPWCARGRWGCTASSIDVASDGGSCAFDFPAFNLLGFDVMMDEDSTVHLLELNAQPSLHIDTPFDLAVKTDLVTQMLALVGAAPPLAPPPSPARHTRPTSSARRPSTPSAPLTPPSGPWEQVPCLLPSPWFSCPALPAVRAPFAPLPFQGPRCAFAAALSRDRRLEELFVQYSNTATRTHVHPTLPSLSLTRAEPLFTFASFTALLANSLGPGANAPEPYPQSQAPSRSAGTQPAPGLPLPLSRGQLSMLFTAASKGRKDKNVDYWQFCSLLAQVAALLWPRECKYHYLTLATPNDACDRDAPTDTVTDADSAGASASAWRLSVGASYSGRGVRVQGGVVCDDGLLRPPTQSPAPAGEDTAITPPHVCLAQPNRCSVCGTATSDDAAWMRAPLPGDTLDASVEDVDPLPDECACEQRVVLVRVTVSGALARWLRMLRTVYAAHPRADRAPVIHDAHACCCRPYAVAASTATTHCCAAGETDADMDVWAARAAAACAWTEVCPVSRADAQAWGLAGWVLGCAASSGIASIAVPTSSPGATTAGAAMMTASHVVGAERGECMQDVGRNATGSGHAGVVSTAPQGQASRPPPQTHPKNGSGSVAPVASSTGTGTRAHSVALQTGFTHGERHGSSDRRAPARGPPVSKKVDELLFLPPISRDRERNK